MKSIILTIAMFIPFTLMSQTYVGKIASHVLVDNPDKRYAVNDGEFALIDNNYVYIFCSATPNDSIYGKCWITFDDKTSRIASQHYTINKLCLREIMLQIHSLELAGVRYYKYEENKYTHIIAVWREKQK